MINYIDTTKITLKRAKSFFYYRLPNRLTDSLLGLSEWLG